MFAKNIMEAGASFLANPMETPFIPSWNRVVSAMPNILNDLKQAVEDDYAEFSSLLKSNAA
jgi:glucosyl-3-phosphoglycerate synthase